MLNIAVSLMLLSVTVACATELSPKAISRSLLVVLDITFDEIVNVDVAKENGLTKIPSWLPESVLLEAVTVKFGLLEFVLRLIPDPPVKLEMVLLLSSTVKTLLPYPNISIPEPAPAPGPVIVLLLHVML